MINCMTLTNAANFDMQRGYVYPPIPSSHAGACTHRQLTIMCIHELCQSTQGEWLILNTQNPLITDNSQFP